MLKTSLVALGAFALLGQPAFGTTLPQVIDGHSDFAIHYLNKGWSTTALDIEKGLPGQADVPRWREGGVNGALATIGSDQAPSNKHHFARVLASLDWLDALIARHGSSLSAARSAVDFEIAAAAGKMALMPAIEGGDQLDGSLENLRSSYARGVRSIGIVYDHHNVIGDGAMVMPGSKQIASPANGGLSPFGRVMVAEMNRLGMLVDLSHAAESTALEAIGVSTAPVIFSHSAARSLADTPRNLSDQVLRSVAKIRGIVMVPLVPYLITTDHWRWWSSGEAKYAELTTRLSDQATVKRGMEEWDNANPQPPVTIEEVADQIEYIASVAGKDHVGIGTDFDGMDDFKIDGLKDAAALPKLLNELRSRGWSPAELEKLARGNFLRVLQAVEAIARH